MAVLRVTTVNRWCWLAGSVLVAVLPLACADPTPNLSIEACLTQQRITVLPNAPASPPTTEGPTTAICTFETEITLVAVPSVTPSVQELSALGIPDVPAELIHGVSLTGDKWCTVEVVKASDPAARDGWRTPCTRSSIQIERALLGKGRKIDFSFARDSRGTHLTAMRVTGPPQ